MLFFFFFVTVGFVPFPMPSNNNFQKFLLPFCSLLHFQTVSCYFLGCRKHCILTVLLLHPYFDFGSVLLFSHPPAPSDSNNFPPPWLLLNLFIALRKIPLLWLYPGIRCRPHIELQARGTHGYCIRTLCSAVNFATGSLLGEACNPDYDLTLPSSVNHPIYLTYDGPETLHHAATQSSWSNLKMYPYYLQGFFINYRLTTLRIEGTVVVIRAHT